MCMWEMFGGAPGLKIKRNRSSTDQFSISNTTSKLTQFMHHTRCECSRFISSVKCSVVGLLFFFMSDLSMSRKIENVRKSANVQWRNSTLELRRHMLNSTCSVPLNGWKCDDNFSCKNRRLFIRNVAAYKCSKSFCSTSFTGSVQIFFLLLL